MQVSALDIGILFIVALLTIWYFTSKVQKPAPVQKGKVVVSKKKSILDKCSEQNCTELVVGFYGSQTGTAEDMCRRTMNEITSNYGIKSLCLDLEEYDMEELQQWSKIKLEGNKWVLGFFMASYGEGEPTDNAVDFYTWLMNGNGIGEDKGDQEDEMVDGKYCDGVDYFCFGLGNKTYEHFNAIGKRVDNRLAQLGASRVYKFGQGDDDGSLEDDYLQWKPGFLEKMGEFFGKAACKQEFIPMFCLEDSLDPFIGELSSAGQRRWKLQGGEYKEVNSSNAFDAKHPYYGKVLTSRPLFTGAIDKTQSKLPVLPNEKALVADGYISIERQCFHFEVDLGPLSYTTGDHIGVWADHEDHLVEKLAARIGMDLEKVISIVPNPEHPLSSSVTPPFPSPTTVRSALKYYLDIKSFLKQHHFDILAHYATSEKAVFTRISKDRQKFLNEIEKHQKTLLDILMDYPNLKIPASVVLTELLPRVAVRYYSISSSSQEHPKTASITAVVVRYPLETNKEVVIKEGVATSWLQRIHEKKYTVNDGLPINHVPLYIRTSNFRLPQLSLPIIMVGPGTGIAPFRGFIRERYHLAKKGEKVGETVLFYGCRRSDQDFLYKDELYKIRDEAESIGFPFSIVTAFSRETKDKVYVQHKIKEHQEKVWQVLQTGYFYVCGDAKHMAHDVYQEIINLAEKHGESNPAAWAKRLKTSGRYLEDVWS